MKTVRRNIPNLGIVRIGCSGDYRVLTRLRGTGGYFQNREDLGEDEIELNLCGVFFFLMEISVPENFIKIICISMFFNKISVKSIDAASPQGTRCLWCFDIRWAYVYTMGDFWIVS